MKTHIAMYFKILILGSVLALSMQSAQAADSLEPRHKVVIQVSTADPQVQNLAINNAVNLQKLYGMDNVKVEIVAYGPGLSILTTSSKQKERVKSLATQDITFSACANTMKAVKKKTGKDPVLIQGVTIVPSGVARIVELQEQGYSYVRP